jgi:hypothetical protein
MDSLRSKNEFDYNSDDFKFPYGTVAYGTKKVTVFNYSSETFRRKKSSSGSGLYYINGGNIPSDMDSSEVYNVRPSGDSYVTLVCSLNKGTALRNRKVDVLNLSPNDIPLFPTLCDSESIKPKPINYEEGKNHKPNFAYLPAFQYSCSDHPRSSGYAHEDNYDCLKSMKDAGTPKGVCCDEVAACVQNGKIHAKGLITFGVDSGKYVFGGGSLANSNYTPQSKQFYCLTNGDKLEECEYQKSCDAGVSYGNSLSNVSMCGAQEAYGYVGFDGVCGCIADGPDRTWYPAVSYTTRTFHISGNKDCGCQGSRIGGAVYINGYTDCQYCERWCTSRSGTGCPPGKKGKDANGQDTTLPASSGGRVCTETTMSAMKYCACNFTFAWAPDLDGSPRYYTSFQYPTNQFTNFAGMAPGGGGLTSVACDSTYHTDCGDIS